MIRCSTRESDFHNAGRKATTRPLPKKKSLFPLTLVAIAALTLGAGGAWGGPQVTTATPRATVSKNPTAQHRWHTPRRSARPVSRSVVEAHPRDWNPLARPASKAKAFLKKVGITTDLFLMFFDQAATQVREGQHNYGTFAWNSVGDWEILSKSALGASYVEWNLNGTVGLNYNPGVESLSENGGIISVANNNVYPDGAALNELFWKQVSPGGRLVVMAGQIDQSVHFDTNRVANDPIRKLFSSALVNNPSIPWPLYGGVGGVVHWNTTDRLALRLGVGDSSSDEPWEFWRTADDGSWYQLFEVDLALDLPHLGKGHYKIIPWHNHLDGEDGWGLGLNLDQQLGLRGLVGFFRFGVGEESVTPVKTFVSGGFGFDGPFGRSGDYFALGVAWSDPSQGTGVRNETILETVYRFQLTPTLELSADFQFVFDPAANPQDDFVFVPGVRFAFVF